MEQFIYEFNVQYNGDIITMKGTLEDFVRWEKECRETYKTFILVELIGIK